MFVVNMEENFLGQGMDGLGLSRRGGGGGGEEVQRSTKEEQIRIVLLDLTSLSDWLHYYY